DGTEMDAAHAWYEFETHTGKNGFAHQRWNGTLPPGAFTGDFNADFRFKIPEIQHVFYVEFGREDHEHTLNDARIEWDHSQAHLIGIKQLFDHDFFFIVERANNVQPRDQRATRGIVYWYTHHEYTNGWTYDGINLGHHMGADSEDSFLGFGQEKSDYSWMFFADTELHGIAGTPKNQQEYKTEVGLTGFYQVSRQWRVDASILMQNFENFGKIADNSLASNAWSFGVRFTP
ncbi:MAG: hypothetical protein HQM11_21420, partial [SAR324 cluster bacterium]|nr:hypothetical protein [SAR324 cluster bacterium]